MDKWVCGSRKNHDNKALRTTLNPVQPACRYRTSIIGHKSQCTIPSGIHMLSSYPFKVGVDCYTYNMEVHLPQQKRMQSTSIDKESSMTSLVMLPSSPDITLIARRPRYRIYNYHCQVSLLLHLAMINLN
jgi:hypothetical protein